MDLSVEYLGLRLKHPFVLGASPIVDDLDKVRRAVEAGASAIVMHSLFEEQLHGEQLWHERVVQAPSETFAEALSYLPEPTQYALGPHEYLEQIRRIKQAVDVPVIGSLNGTTPSGWLEYAALIEGAGADALELNLYALASNPDTSAAELEGVCVEVVRSVRERTRLPIAIKLSPYYTCLGHFAKSLVEAGANGLVLFNRFYQPDIDIDELEVEHTLHLSDPSELLLRLRWLSILSGQLQTDYAVTGGIHDVTGATKAIMAGAQVVQLVSHVLKHGPGCFATLPKQLNLWLEVKEYESLAQLRGSMNLARCSDPSAFERSNYIKVLQGWRQA